VTLLTKPLVTLNQSEQGLTMSYDQFLTITDEDTHAEWVDGEAIFFMPPDKKHQQLMAFLVALLRTYCDHLQLGEVLTAPFEMKADVGSNAREPDILFVAQANQTRITDKKLEGPADLVIEIISSSSVTRDRSDKFYEYQDIGVREYWLIDPRPRRKRADFWVLDENGRYRPVPIGRDGIYRSTILPDFWLDTNWLWQENLPPSLRAFALIVGPDRLIEFLQQMKG
jgi:Uma2 family endonuclease